MTEAIDPPVVQAIGLGAFETAVRPHLPAAARLARRFAPLGEADDALQDALLAAWRHFDRFDPARGALRPWLLAIVLAESRRAGQKHRRRRLLADLLTRHGAGVEPAHGQENPRDAAVRAAVTALSRRQREVVWLHYFVDLPVDEVAQVLSISAGTVKSTLFDARRRVGETLRGQGWQ